MTEGITLESGWLKQLDASVQAERSEAKDKPHQIGKASINYLKAREILTRATGFMDTYDYTLNPYSGCSFACNYCYAAFFSRGRSPDSWGKWVTVKENAVALIRNRQSKLRGKLVYMSSVTDPYQPIERKLELTRGLLEAMKESEPKLVVQTRSPDVTRDIDLFHQIVDSGGKVQVNITVTTDDEDVRRTFEPSCPSSKRRLRAAKELCDSGVATCITMTPLLWVQEPADFIGELSSTGVRKFISQPFHFQRGKFVAGTREAAQRLMADKLGCGQESFWKEYLDYYKRIHSLLAEGLPALSEGKAGFAPGF